MKNNINPLGLKGNQINERMKELMGIAPINENKSTSVVELTKIGPDGKAYAIVRENHQYFIKSTDKKTDIISEDFNYIGGLQNKISESYTSYAKAIKHLNLKFNSLSEAFNTGANINVFKNDNLLTESGIAGFSQYGGSGFANEGNLEGSEPLFEEEDEEEDEVGPISEYFDNPDDKLPSKGSNRWDSDDAEENEDDEDLTEAEKAVEDMMESEDEEVPENKEDYTKQPGYVQEHKLSIARALTNMDSIIDDLNENDLKKKVYTLK